MRKEDRYFRMNRLNRKGRRNGAETGCNMGKGMGKFFMITGLTGALLFSGCGAGNAGDSSGKKADSSAASEQMMSVDQIKKGNTSFGISCHDPQIILADGTYYMTGSHQVIAKSGDLTSWEYVVNGNKMFDNIFSGDLPAFSYVGKNEEGGYSIWASNIVYNENIKKYIMYFCTSSSYIKSNLCMAISDKPEGPYHYTETFLYSGFDEKEAKKTNLKEVLGKKADISKYLEYGAYNNKKWPNCIDPAVFTDAEGKEWMVYGSWSGGIFLLELDKETGLPIHPENDEENGVDAYFGYHLIGGGHHAAEGPYISYDKETGYYYLFVSYGGLTREGGYQIREYRSKNPTGPYVDGAGKTLGDEKDYFNFGIKMAGNYKFPSLETAYMAPGGQSVFTGADGNLYITYHQRFDSGSEYHEPRVHRLYTNEEGWYVMAPFETGTEQEIKDGFGKEDINGTFYLLNHGIDVGSKIYDADECSFSDGKIEGLKDAASYEVKEGSSFITLTVKDVKYSGVIMDMKDEAGNNVRCISACGPNNRTIWAVQYTK